MGNYNRDTSILLSTHLISDVENILEEVVLIREGMTLVSARIGMQGS